MNFKYTAQDGSGQRVIETVRAESASDLVGQLKKRGLLPLRIEQIKDSSAEAAMSGSFFSREATLREIAVFTRQLSSTIAAGITIVEALDMLAKDMDNRILAKIILDVKGQVEGGSFFSMALAKYPKVFSVSYVAMVKAGEKSGTLGRTLGHLAKYLEGTERLAQKIKQSIRYPAFIFSFMLFVLSVIVFFIIPKFKVIFSQAKVQLPLLTRIVVGISEASLKNLPWFILFGVVVFFSVVFIFRRPQAKYAFDQYKIRIPVVGKVVKKALLVHFSRSLSILLSSGVPLPASLPISADVASNLYLRGIVEKITKSVLSGATLSNAFKNHEIFPFMFVKMVQVGERTGKLSEMFGYNADYYDEELEIAVNALTDLIEPVLIVVIGAVVLVVVLALYLPIFKIASAVR
ncbi:MAG TPA: hypothetical protein DCL35_08205 [Candidatus Omnitrophica bacterium]|nr:hypothetical protein [Candidatus Omnitrophota bacterium]